MPFYEFWEKRVVFVPDGPSGGGGGPVDPGFGVRPPVDPGYGIPGFGPVDPGYGRPVYPNRPDQGLPGYGRPDQGLPGFPVRPDQGLPGYGRPDQGLPGYGHPGQGLPQPPHPWFPAGGGGPVDPGYGRPGWSPVDPGYGRPIYPNRPDQGLPGYGRPDQGLPGYGRPDQGLPGYGRPDQGLPQPPHPWLPGYGGGRPVDPGYGRPGWGGPVDPGFGGGMPAAPVYAPLPPGQEPPSSPPTELPDMASPGYWCYVVRDAKTEAGFVQTSLVTDEGHEPKPPTQGTPGEWVAVVDATATSVYAWIPDVVKPDQELPEHASPKRKKKDSSDT